MSDTGPAPDPARLRREPPAFRRAAVQAVSEVTPRLIRVTLGGRDLDGFTVDEPAASVRVLLPPTPGSDLVMPVWNGNEFLFSDGSRPPIRTLTPLRVEPSLGTFDVEIVVHGGGAASTWAASASSGDEVAVSGPGRGYEVDPGAAAYVLAGDETAIPAITQLIEDIPGDVPVHVLVEVADPAARLDLAAGGAGAPEAARDQATGSAGAAATGARIRVDWLDLPPGAPPGESLVAAVAALDIPPGAKAWVAGEAAAVQRIRKHLFTERNMSRADATVRGYWKHGRAASSSGDSGDG